MGWLLWEGQQKLWSGKKCLLFCSPTQGKGWQQMASVIWSAGTASQ